MNTKEYIASGILENFLLNNCSTQERQEVECLSKIYPDIKRELISLEIALEKLAQSQGKSPPSKVWEAIVNKIDAEETNSEVSEAEPVLKVVHTDNIETPKPRKANRGTMIWRVAASIAIAATSSMVFSYYQTNNQLKVDYAKEQAMVLQLEQNLQKVLVDVESQNRIITTMASPETQRVVLNGVETKDPNSAAFVVYNPLTREVYLNQGTLPANPQNTQYQLWALKDGQPIDLGVFDIADANSFIAMKGVDGAQAFAITLEERGGKPTPNLEQLFVIGELG